MQRLASNRSRGEALLLALSVGVFACQQPVDDDPFADEGGESEVGGGVFLVEVDLPAEETAGDGPIPIPTGACLTIVQDPLHGYTHQCEGQLSVSWDGTAVVLGQQFPFDGQTGFGFGPGASNPDWWVDEDRYDNPLVAACCGIFDYEMPTTEEKLPYVNNCIFDSVQQVCLGLPRFIDRLAEQIPQSEKNRSAKQKGLRDISDYIDSHTDDCIWSLWETPPGPFWPAPNELGGTEFSFCWTGNDCVTFILDSVVVTDWTIASDIPDPVPEWEICYSWDDNNTSVLPTADIVVPDHALAGSGVALPGSLVSLTSPFGFETLVLNEAMTQIVSRLDGSGAVAISQLTLSAVDLSEARNPKITLDSPLRPDPGPAGWVVPAGEQSFTGSVAFDGGSRIVKFTNVSQIVFRQTATGWAFDPFALSYVDLSGGQWQFDISGLEFEAD